MRAAIYARYSSENQREASLEDQIRMCRRVIETEGWQIVQIYRDRAQSGASPFRPAYQEMCVDADAGHFDLLMVESLDRLGRNLAEIAGLHDRLSFLGIQLHAANAGEITALHIGLLGTMAQLTLADLKDKTKRGQLGRALKGKIPGGLAYGYDVVPAKDKGAGGERRINAAEAPVVRRIFRAYAAGKSPRAIARALNETGTPGPGGRPWRDTTIRGQVERRTGILNNSLYIGRLEWNRCSYVTDPRTGKRIARPNPPEAWEVVAVPDLRIIDDDLWQAVKTRQQNTTRTMERDEDGNALNRAHRRRFLFSGLLKCGLCGGGYTIMGKDRYGCATHRAQGTCTNTRTITRQAIEARILRGLEERLLAPELVAAFIEEFQAETARLLAERRQRQLADRARLVEIDRRIEGLLTAIEDGNYHKSLTDRLTTLEWEREQLKADLETEPEAPVVSLHPNLGELYRRKVARLEASLSDPAVKDEAGAILRSLIDRVVLQPRDRDKGLDAILEGDLARILAFCEGSAGTKKRPGSLEPGRQLSVVAGAGFEPATFRL